MRVCDILDEVSVLEKRRTDFYKAVRELKQGRDFSDAEKDELVSVQLLHCRVRACRCGVSRFLGARVCSGREGHLGSANVRVRDLVAKVKELEARVASAEESVFVAHGTRSLKTARESSRPLVVRLVAELDAATLALACLRNRQVDFYNPWRGGREVPE